MFTKHFIASLLILTSESFLAAVSMTRVNPHLFVNQAQTDFSLIANSGDQVKRKIVKNLFDQHVLDHDGTPNLELNANFERYYEQNKNHFLLLDLNQDGKSELIFQGFTSATDDKEYTEIYRLNHGKYELQYREVGHLLAYKIHPNTKEIVLYQHKYPCCSAMSHNIFVLRLLDGKFHKKSKYFLARDTGMKGDFFPDSVNFPSNYERLSTDHKVYWSDSVILEGASRQSPSNQLITYPAGTVYQILTKKGTWSYVLIRGNCVSEKSLIVNAENLSQMALFAWIKV